MEGPQESYFRPSRLRLSDAQAVARDVDTPAEAWEAMASRGFIPFEWAQHTSRRFVAYAQPAVDDATPASASAPLTHPPTRAACVAFASDPSGVAAAEELAGEVFARLAPWGVARPSSLTWLVGEACVPLSLRASGFARLLDTIYTLAEAWASSREGRYAQRDRSKVRRAARTSTLLARRERWGALRYGGGSHANAAFSADLSHALALWDFAEREFLHVSRMATMRHGLPRALLGVRVGSLPSPFEPLVALYRLGYGLGPLAGDALHLAAVEPEAP